MSGPGGPRAALVHDWLTGMRGGEKVLECLAELLPEAPIYTLFHLPGSLSPELERRQIRTTLLQYAPGLRRHYRSLLPLFPAAIEEHDLGGFDLVVSSSHCVAKSVLSAPGARHLCYCHTPMRYVWDQRHAYFPRRHGPRARLLSLLLDELGRWDQATSDRVDRYVANSSFVAGRIRRYYGRQAVVVPPPVDTEFFTPVDGTAGRDPADGYCLVVAALAPYKRVETAIEACARLGRELRIVGDGTERARLERAAAGRAKFLGRVGDEELRDLYRGAGCFLQPQIEDFGIAAAEALACGCPVVGRGEGGVLDIVEDGRHGVLYRPATTTGDADEMAAAIERLDGVRPRPDVLRDRAEGFSRENFLRRMRTQIAELTGGGRLAN